MFRIQDLGSNCVDPNVEEPMLRIPIFQDPVLRIQFFLEDWNVAFNFLKLRANCSNAWRPFFAEAFGIQFLISNLQGTDPVFFIQLQDPGPRIQEPRIQDPG